MGRTDKMQDESLWASRDRRFAPWYVPVFLLGYAFSIGLSLFVGLPVTYYYFSGVLNHLLHSTPLSSDFWDASIFLSLNVLQLSIAGLLFVRDIKTRHGSGRTPLTGEKVGRA
jgi:hypothetical protein